MAITTYSASPYFDDFDQDKNYLRILFRPGRSIQVRELNQIQSNVQDQIDKFGRHVFKDGDRVLDGYTNYDSSIQSIGVTFTGDPTNLSDTELEGFKGKEIFSGANWRAKILSAVKVTDATDGYRLYIKLIGGPGTFNNGDAIGLGANEDPITINGTDYTSGTIANYYTAVEELGYHGGVFQDAGVFFVKGHFVHTDATEAFYPKVIVTPASSSEAAVISKLTGAAVFDIVETVVGSGTDDSLLDNASGEPNLSAPGGDRYKISLNLSFVPSTDLGVAAGQQRIKLLDIREDKVIQPARTQYSELGKVLAQRTEEESGSYVVNPFKYDVREYLNDSTGNGNRGRYTATEIEDGNLLDLTNSNATTEGAKRYVIGVEPGVAYIQGYRVELENKQDVVANKGRDGTLPEKTGYNFSADRGQFIEGALTDGDALLSAADIDKFIFSPNKTYNFYNVAGGSTLIGTCRIQAIENTGTQSLDDSTPENAEATKRLYIYDINLVSGKKLSEARVLTINNEASSSTGQGYLQNDDGFAIKQIGDNSSRMIYSLGSYDIADINTSSATYVTQKSYTDLTPSSGIVTVDISSGNDSFISTDPEDYVVVQVGTGTDDANGETYVKNVSISGQVATISLARANGVAVAASEVTIFAPIRTALTVRSKTQTTGVTKAYTRRLDPGDVITLDKTDVYAIDSVTHDGNDVPISDFELVTGQTDTHYGYSQVIYKGTANFKLSGNNGVVVTFSHYTHGAGNVFAGNGYFVSGSTRMNLEDIPTYEELKLANCLDFRPLITDSTSTRGTEIGIKPNSVVLGVKFNYYYPRKDIVVLNQLGNIQFIEGVPAETPVYSKTPTDSILLYRIEKPGYLYTLDDLKIERVENRRYSMKDIGSLESRIQNLEYYASLSQLESEAAETQLIDSAGPRFKGGILTDSFRGHGVGDVSSPGYKAAIDRENFTARPTYLSDNARWSFVISASGGLQPLPTKSASQLSSSENPNNWDSNATVYSGKRNNSLTLDFIEKVLVDQPYASDHISVNPYDVATWSGSLELSPSSDEWKDINFVPDIIHNIEGDNSAVINQIANNPNILGTEWNEWESQWTAKTQQFGRWWERKTRTIQVPDTFTETTWVSSTKGTQKQFRRQNREGIQTSLVENTEREVIGDELLNVTFVPFIRSRKVYFKARMLKPNTTFNLFFDDVNITSYATDDEEFVQFGGNVAGGGGTDVARYEGKQGNDVMSPSATPAIASGITTNSAGDVDGWFVIPNNNVLRFRTGSRQVRLSDRSDNNKTLELSAAESTYHAKGILETRQRTILSTRQLVIERTRLQESRNLLIGEKVVRRDPIAQTFMIGNEPTGIFLSSVDIFFQKIDPNLPVELSIVSVENGIPTQNTVPFSKVIKLPTGTGAVVPSADASTKTKFMFDTPVYLQPGVEYAIVLISNSARYRVWHAEVGGTNVVPSGANAEKITKNVNLGVMLKSQNASTWTPDQNKDLKFTLNRADFKTGSATAVFTGLSPQRGQVTYVNVTDGGSGYLTGPPAITIGGTTTGGATTQATAKAHIGKGGVIDHVEVITNGVGYTDVPDVAIAAPEEISINASVPNEASGGVYLSTDTKVRLRNVIALPANIAEAANGQRFKHLENGGSALTGLTNNTVYFAKTVDIDVPDSSAPLEVSHSRYIQLSTTLGDAAIALGSRGGAPQTLLPVKDSAGNASTGVATAERDVWKASSYLPIIQDMLLPESNVDYTLNTSATSSYTVFPGELIYTSERVTHDSTSAYNGPTQTPAGEMLKLQATLSTTDSKISPVVDLDRISLVTFDNIVNNSSVFEDTRDDGQCAARYITKSIKLSSPADQINIFVDAMRPDSSTSIEVYAKFKSFNSTDSFGSLNWTKINPKDGRGVPVSTNFKFKEVEFEGTTSDEYDQVAIKVLFKSSNKAFVPEIKNLRVIATL